MISNFWQAVYSAISQAIREDLEAYTSQRILATQNSRNFLKWDLINTNIINNLRNNLIEVEIVRMGSWKFLLIFDKENNCIYSLMNTKRYNTICNNKLLNAPLYMQALVELNNNLGYAINPLFDLPSQESGLHNLLRSLCSSFTSRGNNLENVNYKIITFTTNQFDEVIGLNLITLDTNLEQLEKEDLFRSVVPEYQNNIEQISDEESQKPLLKITKKGEQRIGERTQIALKQNDESDKKQA